MNQVSSTVSYCSVDGRESGGADYGERDHAQSVTQDLCVILRKNSTFCG